jgi:hypothetical protein
LARAPLDKEVIYAFPLYEAILIKMTDLRFGIETSVPWFPRKMSDLDSFAEKVLEMGEDLSKINGWKRKVTKHKNLTHLS